MPAGPLLGDGRPRAACPVSILAQARQRGRRSPARGLRGYLVADAHSVYDHLYARGDVIEVGCWAHCRRYFYKSLGTEPELARHALGLIRKLFKVEEKLAEEARKKRESVRRKVSAPIVDGLFSWCDEQAEVALDGSPIAAALTYARNQRVALRRFLGDGRLPLDNNISERALAPYILSDRPVRVVFLRGGLASGRGFQWFQARFKGQSAAFTRPGTSSGTCGGSTARANLAAGAYFCFAHSPAPTAPAASPAKMSAGTFAYMDIGDMKGADEAEEDLRLALLLNKFLLILAIWNAVAASVAAGMFAYSVAEIGLSVLPVALLIGLRALILRGYVQGTSIILVAVTFAVGSVSAWTRGGIHSSAVAIYLLVLMLAAFLLRMRALWVTFSLSIAAACLLAAAESLSYLPSGSSSPWDPLVSFLIVFTWAAVFLHMAIGSLQRARWLARFNHEQASNERARADELLHNMLPRGVAEQLKRKIHPIAERFESATVLFADLVGFTQFCSSRSPESIVDVLNDILTIKGKGEHVVYLVESEASNRESVT